MAFPDSLDSFNRYVDGTTVMSAGELNLMQAAIENLEAKVGATGSIITTSHDYKIGRLHAQAKQIIGETDISYAVDAWADMSLMTITLTTTGGGVLLLFSTTTDSVGAGDDGKFRFDLDGTSQYHEMYFRDMSSLSKPFGFHYFITPVTADTHIFKVQWRATSGTIKQNGVTQPRVFTAMECPIPIP